MVRHVSDGMRKGMAYYEILKLVLRSITQAIPCARASVYLVDEGNKSIAREIAVDCHNHFETGHTGKVTLNPAGGDDFSDIVLKKKEQVFERRSEGEYLSAIKVPLEASGQVVGLLVVERRRGQPSFTPDEGRTLLTFATQAGFVLENIRLHYELVQLAFKDEVTGQYNHRFFIKRLREEVDRSMRYQHVFSVLLAGLDRFTAFNDQYGYAMGDKMLIEWGRFLHKSHRACDLVARLGGDKFAILLPETPAQGAQVVAENIRKAVEGFLFTEEEGLMEVRNRFTASLGIAEFPAHGLMLEQILDRANRALDHAKSLGGNQVVLSPEKNQEPTL